MPPRAAIHNGIITVVILFFMLLLAMLLKARYRLHKEPVKAIPVAEAVKAPKAIPVAVPLEEQVQEARAYRQGEWWVLPDPNLVPGTANEADTLRIRSGPKEDVFVLYFVDAAEVFASRPKRLRDQAALFENPSTDAVLSAGVSAMKFVSSLLTQNKFKVYTKWERVPGAERYYGFVTVELEQGKHFDLGELLVRKGYASPRGHQISGLPAPLPKSDQYVLQLGKAMGQAKAEHAGAWTKAE
ncbi:hypothetical protein DES53_11430 [Roseimicrobium gellanilyticum]|uniref:TNase-like domain-containing protein n=1 Tax=Roseimicrobium gellanilyticum TaxID=748857 RepID=A0A366H5U1_9BACT|nr:hypothetical protein [Roseimicrobium gellanilyticum]RBP37292.1 hypothetical protein DES53_11430 [Roseimicrobium gellanilyticum]